MNIIPLSLTPESQNLNDYLVSNDVVEAGHPRVIEIARHITRHAECSTESARALFEWVRDNIPHSGDIGATVRTCSATEVLKHGTGTCFSKCHLLAALLRAMCIPAGFCYQVLMNDPPHDTSLVLHGLTGIYLSDHERWTAVDARGNTGSLDAQFSTHTPKLAFPMDPAAGEHLMETIYVWPLPAVIKQIKSVLSG